MSHSSTISITMFPSRRQTTPTACQRTTLGAVAQFYANPPVMDTPKDALPFWNGAVFRDGGKRCNADVQAVTAAFLDHDGTRDAIEPFLAELTTRGLEHLVIPSPRHFDALPAAYKIRVIVPYSEPVAADEHRRLWAWLNAMAGGVLDRQAKAPSQGFCIPACRPEHAASWWTRHEPGEPLDVRALLAAVPEGERSDAPARAPLAGEIERFSRVAEPAIAEYLETLPERVSEGDRHRILFSLAQRCRDWGVDPVPHVGRYNATHCDPPKTEDELARVLENIDRYRWHPPGFELGRVNFLGLDHTPVLDRTLETLAESAPQLYRRAGQLATLADDGTLVAASEHRVSELVSHHVKLYRHVPATAKRAEHWTRTGAPPWVAKELLARGEWPRIRELEGVVNLPSMRTDGSIITSPGYDAASCLFYRPQGGLRVEIPEAPTLEQGKAALDRVAGLFEQFPFETEPMRAAHLALVATTVARPMLDGPVPIGVFDANRAQCGKSKLTAAVAIIMTGELPARKTWHANETVMADQLYSSATAGDRVLYFDNVKNGSTIESPALDGALTAMRVIQRRRYTDIDTAVPFRPIVLVSGNGVRVGGDIEARAIYVRLVSTLEDPATRADIVIPDLQGYIKQRRGEIVGDLLTAWSAWILADRPGLVAPWNTFAQWDAVRRMLACYGYADPFDTRQALRDLDDTTDLLRGLIDYIAQQFPAGACKARGGQSSVGGCGASELLNRLHGESHLLRAADHTNDPSEVLSGLMREAGGKPLDSRIMGIILSRYRDRVCGGRRLVVTTVRGQKRWSVR